MSILFWTEIVTISPDTVTLWPQVPKRPIVSAPDFGRWLQTLRGDRSLEQVAIQLRPLVKEAGLKVNPSLIHKIEGGRVPNWPLLAAFAQVYGFPIAEMAGRLAELIKFPGADDLIRHEGDQGSAQPKGRSDVPAPATPARVQSINPDVVRALENVAVLVTKAIAEAKGQPVRTKNAGTGAPQPGVRRRAGGDR